MNQEAVRALPEKELTQIIVWAQDELRLREEKHREDTIAKIKEMAASVGVPIHFNMKRGRPAKKAESAFKKRAKP